MSNCELAILLESENQTYRSGDVLRGTVEVRVDALCLCNKLTIALQWRTHGFGNRTEGQPETQVLFTGEWTVGAQHLYAFEVRIPPGPATYHGKLLNVDWYVTARADIPWALDPKAEIEVLVVPVKTGDYSFGPEYRIHPEEWHSRNWKRIPLGIIGCVLVAIGLLELTIAIPGMGDWITASEESGDMFGGLILFLIGGGIFMAARLVEKRIGVSSVRIHPSVIRPGERTTVSVRLTPPAAASLTGISATLFGRERVTRGSGTNRTTHTHEIHTSPYVLIPGNRDIQPNEPVECQAELTLPPDSPPTFVAIDNKLEWRISVHIGISRWPDWKKDFPITVRP